MLSRFCCSKGLNVMKQVRLFKVPARYVATCKTEISKPGAGSGQRDLVNFPRPKRLENIPPVVFGFIPKSWFDFFYSKTGVTGGYTFLFGLGVYLFSKEYIVVDPEFILCISFISLCTIVSRTVPEIREYFEKEQMEHTRLMDSSQENKKKNLRDEIEYLKKIVSQTEGVLSMLPEAKRENVYLQQEAIYRSYLKDVHLAVLNRLNYNVEKTTIERLFLKKNLISWIQHNVEAGITPEIKKAALKKAISELKDFTSSRKKS